MSPRVVSGDGVKAVVPFWRDFFGGSNAEKWGNYRKKNFFINNSVALSMCDRPIETDK